MQDNTIPEGYQLTEVGVIPVDWDVKMLGELFSFKNGVNADKKSYGKGIKFINILEVIENNSLSYDDIIGFITLDLFTIKQNLVYKGDVLFNRTSETQEEIGLTSVYLDDKDVVFGGFVIRARPITNLLDYNYCKYGFSAKNVRFQIIRKGQGAVRANIGQSDLKEVVFPLPPLNEQKRIAKVLSTVDELISALDELITKKRNIKQGTMQQLLTGKTRLSGFTGEWEVKKVGEFTQATAGGTPSTLKSEYWGGNIRWMSSGELNLKVVSDVNGRITDLGLKNSSTKIVPSYCVLIGLAGQGKTRGTVALNTVELCTNQSIAAIYPNANFNSMYLYYNLDSRYDELRSLSTGEGGRGGLNLKIIKNIDIPFPTLKEQKAIAEILSKMDEEIEALEEKRDKYKGIKQGLMAELLTGKKRLNCDGE